MKKKVTKSSKEKHKLKAKTKSPAGKKPKVQSSIKKGLKGKATSLQLKKVKSASSLVEERYKIISEITSDFVFCVIINSDNSKTLDWISDGFKKEMGFPFQNLLKPATWKKYFLAEDHKIISQLNRSIYNNRQTTVEFRIIKSNGDISWHLGTFKPVYDKKEKRVTKYYGASRNITEKKKIELDLVELNNQLEQRIEERTAQLDNAVQNLKHEVSIRTIAENQIRKNEKVLSDVAKNLDKKLRESEYKHLWNIFEHSEIAAVTIAQNGLCLNYNKAAENLLGYAHEELPNVEEWLKKLFPSEIQRKKVRKATYDAMDNNITSQHFAVDVTVKSGEIKHLILQTTSVFHEGSPIGVQLGQLIDVTEQKKSQKLIDQIAEGISTKTGQEFFNSLVENLAKATEADFALINFAETENENITTLAAYGEGKLIDNLSYSIKGTPCENVFAKELCVYPNNVTSLFPKDKMLADLSIQGYAGVPLFNSNGSPLGLLIVLSKNQFTNIDFIKKLLKIFSARAATEIERQNTLQALAYSENRFRIISEQTGDLIYDYDLENNVIHRDGSIKSILGYEKEEYQKLTREEWRKLIHPNDLEEFIRKDEDSIKNSTNFHHIFRFKHKDNYYVTLEENGVTIKGSSGKTTRYLGRLRDITNERAREKYIEMQANLLNAASDSIFLVDNRANIIYVNKRACEILGYEKNELLNQNIQIISPITTDEDNSNRLSQLNEKGSLIFETIHQRKDGTTFPVEVNSKTILIDGESFYLSADRDITERKKAEEDRKESEEKYRQLYESESDAILLIDNETGLILEANGAAEILYGYSKAELLQMRNTDLSGEPSQTKKVTTSTPIQPNTVVHIPLRIHKRKDGTLFSVEITGRFFNYHEKQVHIAAIRDISQRIETENAYKIWSEKNAKALEMAKLGHWEYTISTGKFLLNDQYYSIHKTTAAQAGGYEISAQEFVQKFIYKDDVSLISDAIQKAVESSEKNFEFETDARILLGDGNWRWVTVWFRAQKDEFGNTIKLHGVNQVIHDWKIAEEARAQQQYLIDQLLENVPDLIYFKDLNSKFISVSKSFPIRLNLSSPDQLIGKCDFDIYDYAHAQDAFNDEQEIIRTGIQILGKEEKEILNGGEERWAYTTKMPWRNSKGEIMGTYGISRDITEKKKAESDLKSTLEKYKVLFNVFPLGITVSDEKGNIVESNRASEELLGLSQDEHKRKSIDSNSWKIVRLDGSIMPPEEFASVRALKEGKIINDIEMGIVKPNDKVTWLSVTAAPLPTDEGGVVIAYGDITQNIIAQNALKESEERYRRLIDSSPFALFVHKNGKVLFANEACVKMFRAQSPSDIIGKNLYDYMHPDYLNLANTRLKTINEQYVSVPLMELKYYCHDKTLIDVEASAIPITYYGEQAILVAAHDITEKKIAQSKLYESEIKLRFLIETSPIIVFGLDKNGIFTLSEGNGLKQLGLKPGEVVGRSALEVYKGHAEITKALENALLGIETREISAVGDIVFDISYTPLFDKEGRVEGVSGIAYDVTAQKRFEDELVKAARQWQTTFDSVSDAVWLVDLNSVVIRANMTTERILGKPINEVIGKHCFEIVHGDTKPLSECPVQKMKISLQREHMEYQIGDYWYLVTADPIFNEQGKLSGAVHSIKDITESVQYQNKLKQSEALYRLLSENSADVIWLLDLNTLKFTYVSPSVIKLRGYEPEEVVNQRLDEVMTRESYEYITTNLPKAIENVLRGDNNFIHITSEIDQIHKDGRIIPTEVVTTILCDEHGHPTQILGVSREISERKETEKRLLESEERYRKIIELSPEAIFVHLDGEFLFANRATYALVGVANFDELRSKKLVDYLHPDSIELVLQRINVLSNGENEQMPYAEYKIIKSDGTLAYIESTASAIEFFGVRAIQSVARDVTDRKLAERQLKESQERFRHVVEYSPNAIIIHQSGKIVYSNPTAVKLIGATSVHDLLNKNVLDFMHPDYKAFAIERIKSAAVSMKPLPPAEEKILCLDGTILDVEIVSVPFYLNNSLAYQLIIRDITEIKSKTEELRKLSRAVEQNSASVIITNNHGVIEYVNPKFLETTGYVLEEIIGQTPRILKSGKQSESFYKNLWSTVLSGNEWRGEFQNKTKTGEIYWDFTSISPIKNSAGIITHFVAIKEDITERKKFDDEMQIAKDEAEHAYKVKFSLLANMSHELRTPLNGILGFSQLLKDYIAEEDGKEMLEKIIKSTQRLSSTFTEILSLTELEMGDVTLKNSLVDLAFFCKELRLLFIDRAEAKNLSIDVDLAIETQSTYCDEGWLLRIATHLIENAIKFTSKGGITIQLAEPIVKEELEYAVINIIDTGIGIKKEEQKSLFKEFRQISEGVRRDFEGLGLGLSLAKRMSHNLNGFITFESEYEVGSTFTIHIPMLDEIPLEKEMPEPVMINKISKAETEHHNMNIKILLVEDNPLNIEVVEHFLAKTGEVTAVRDGNAAVKAAQKEMFDLLLVDISLGHGMDGIEVLKQIRLMESYANIPAIALTGYVSETSRRRFQAAGFNGFLGKPFEKKDLLNYIAKMF